MHFCKAHVLLYTDSNYFSYIVKIIQHFCQTLLFLNLISHSKLHYYLFSLKIILIFLIKNILIFLIQKIIIISHSKLYFYFSFKIVLLFFIQNCIIISHLMCSSSHIPCVEIFDEPRNCCRTWNILVVVFLNCSCEINFRAPSRYRKGFVIAIKIFYSNLFLFVWHGKKQKSK